MNTTERIVEAIRKADIVKWLDEGKLYAAIASVIGQERWISVKDRLPEVGQRVDVWVVNTVDEEKSFRHNNFLFDGGFPNDNPQRLVTHWQPLPAPPLSDLTPPKTKEDGE